ncbi:hypothetical protein M0R89_10890 [Halorussus limi]|uniref:Uncharacterized protein n=1 Tax=Halorussus limi TaxID=2938695 RepID=A0A8U0HQP0_9EURY|nr:hypothetical protein [Halorussus limi]UPV73056.1 hypothetical protein M0R89_10890 [Halorussus limi]
MSEAALVYFGAGTLLFFFWAYGIVSFALDCKNKFLPAAARLAANWRARRRDESREEEREQREQQLY